MQSIEKQPFWSKILRFAGKIPFARDAVALYYCMLDPTTPLWARAQIAAALTYFVAPIDAIPDITPFIGFADDAGILAATIIIIAANLKDTHRKRADEAFAGSVFVGKALGEEGA